MANHPNHAAVTDAAFQAQCPAFREAFAGEHAAMLDLYCMYGDLVHHAKGEEWERMSAFTHLPDGKMAVMGPESVDEAEVTRVYRGQYQYWFQRMAEAIAAADVSAAAQFMGVISHSLGDTAALPHALGRMGLGMQFIRRLFPTESMHRHRPLHNVLEDLPVTVDIGDYQPRLRGETPGESAFNLGEDVARLINATLARFEPALKALYRDDWDEATRIAGLAFSAGARVLADVMHTAWCLGRQAFPVAEREALAAEPIRLAERVPAGFSEWSPYPYFMKQLHRSPVSMDMEMNPVALMLVDEAGQTATYQEGFGIGVRAHVEYAIPAGVYDRLRARIGVHPSLPSSVPVRVTCKLGETCLYSRVFDDASCPNTVDLDVRPGGLLRLATEPAIEIDPLGKVPCHVVVAEPRLTKPPASSQAST